MKTLFVTNVAPTGETPIPTPNWQWDKREGQDKPPANYSGQGETAPDGGTDETPLPVPDWGFGRQGR